MRVLFFSLLLGVLAFGGEIEGLYLLEKDDTGNQSVAEVFEKDGKYYAYGFANTNGSASYDVNNPDAKLKGRPLKGVVFMWGLSKDGNGYSGGRIYNTGNGKTYDASAKVDGDKLLIKASVWGFGKTLTWTRLNEEDSKAYIDKKPDLKEVIPTIPN